MKPVAVQGIGVVGAFGHQVDQLEKALSGCLPVPETVCLDLPETSLFVDVFRADVRPIERIVDKQTLRRLDRYSRMAVLAARQSLEDAGGLNGTRERLGVIIATGYGPVGSTCAFLNSIQDTCQPFPSPTHFSNSVHNAAAANICMHLGITGPALTVSQSENAVTSALLTAGVWLAEDRVDAVLFGVVDEYANMLALFLSQWHPGGDRVDAGPSPGQLAFGEGAVFFLLTSRKDSSGGYGCVEAMHEPMNMNLPFPPHAIILQSGLEYWKHFDAWPVGMRQDNTIFSYQPIYGVTPVAIAFDMAIALLSLKNRSVYLPWNDWSKFHGGCTGDDVPIPNAAGIYCIAWSAQGIPECVHLQ